MHFWDQFSVLVGAFFALQRYLVKTPFLKDVPSEIAVLGFPGVSKTLRKRVPNRVQKRTPKKSRIIAIWGSILGASFGFLGSSWHQGRPRQAQDKPRQAQDRPGQAQDRPKTGPRQAQDSPRQAQDVTAESHCEKSNDATASAGGRSLLNTPNGCVKKRYNKKLGVSNCYSW